MPAAYNRRPKLVPFDPDCVWRNFDGKRCGKKAVAEVFSAAGNLVGKYCRAHGDALFAELERVGSQRATTEGLERYRGSSGRRTPSEA